MRETSSNGFGDLPASLRRATELLRQSPEPTDEWRERLLRAVERETAAGQAGEPMPRIAFGDGSALAGSRVQTRWSLRPLTAIAAGLACALIGGGIVAFVLRGDGSTPQVASAGTHAPVASPTAAPAASAGVPPKVRFTLVAPNASSVSLVGDFNGWNPAVLPLRRGANGTWEVEVPLPAGRYAYAFYVDGALARDPDAPKARDDDYGSVNSVVMVRGAL